MSKNSEYASTMQARLKKFDADLEALTAQASESAREAYDAQVKELRATRDATQKKLRQFQAASESASAEMQAGMEAAWNTMQKALKRVSGELRK